MANCGVAYHHAGMAPGDRQTVERLYLEGLLNVICCTSTLSIGVNLPCYLVIIKNTCTWVGAGTQEYAALDIMQMIGRAGRPQFGSSAMAVIMTKAEKVSRYERIMSDELPIESCLHLNLIEHMNAEVGLGTVFDPPSARHWLSSTYMWTRLQKNPQFYHPDSRQGAFTSSLETLKQIADRDLEILSENRLISNQDGRFSSTPFGEAMARFYVRLDTMRKILSLREQATVAMLVSQITVECAQQRLI